MAVILAASLVGVGLVVVLVNLAHHFFSPSSLPVTAEWIEGLSIDRYRPMLRLLDSSDLGFLRAQPGFKPQMETRLRIQRCRLFRDYLRNLEQDFRRISTALKILMVQSAQDRPDLASVLLRNQMTFAYGMMMVQCQLWCYRYGLGTVDIAGLLKLFDGMRLELRTLVPCELALGA